MQPAESQLQAVSLHELGESLSKLRLCQPAADERMRRSLSQHGQLTAVIAFEEAAGLQLVDGFKRHRAAKRLGWSSLRARVLRVDKATATAVIGALHEHHQLSELEEAWIIHSLCREHGLSQGAVAQLLRRHKSWVSRRLLLVEGLDETVQADVRLGLLTPRSAMAVAVLPRGNQRQAAELVRQRGMTTRQAEGLVRRLLELDSDEARQASMHQWPEASPKTTPRDRPPRSDGEQLLADIATLMRVGVRLEVQLLGMSLPSEQAEVTREALGRLVPLLEVLGKAIIRALKLQDKIDATLAKPRGTDLRDGDAQPQGPQPPCDCASAGHQPQHRPQGPA